MNLLIVGDNPLNARIAGYFRQNGVSAHVLGDAGRLRSLSGQAGEFAAKIEGGSRACDFVLLTQFAGEAPPDIDGGRVRDVYADGKAAMLPKKDPTAAVGFLLDWFCESPLSATLASLEGAAELAGQKKRVYVLARFLRTMGRGTEELYRAARAAGVVFVKYESLEIRFDDAAQSFMLRAGDGVLSYDITVKTLFAHGERAPGAAYETIVKKLNLRTDGQGCAAGDSHFLVPVFTGRRGVYALSREVAAERLDEGLYAVLADMRAFACEPPRTHTALVDGAKCALCYTCYRACPHAAMTPLPAARRMECLPRACEGCGICVSVCPGGAVSLAGGGAGQGGRGKVLLLCCENSAEVAAREALPALGQLAARVHVRAVPCGGSVEAGELAAMLRRYDKVMAAVCSDEACRHFDGNLRACAQAGRLRGMLRAAGADEGRLAAVKVSHAMPLVLRDELAAFMGGDGA